MIWCIYVDWRCMSTCMEWCSWAWAGQHILCLLDKRSWIHRFTKWIAFCCATHWMSNSVWWGAAWMIGTAGWKSLGDDSNSGTTFPVATAERKWTYLHDFACHLSQHVFLILHSLPLLTAENATLKSSSPSRWNLRKLQKKSRRAWSC